jgi:hypothetical protein
MHNKVGFRANDPSASVAFCHSARRWTSNILAAQKHRLKIHSVLLSLVFGLSALPASASISNIYIGENPTGTEDGSSCTNQKAVSYFNTAGNWGSGSGQIGPGTTVHLCGTFTAAPGTSGYLTTHGNGASGNPITILFEANALLTATYWGGPAISIGNSYVTLNGGTNGTIQATANGTNLAYQNGSGECIYSSGASNLLIENLTCSDIYVHVCNSPITSCTDTGGTDSIVVSGGNNISIHDNTVHDTAWAILYVIPGGSTQSNVAIYNNRIYNVDHGPTIGDGGNNAVLNGALIYNNTVHDAWMWDDNADQWHHDGVHVFITKGGSSISGLLIYNNYIYGNWGSHWTASIYVEPSANPSYISNFYVFNNVSTAGSPADGVWYIMGNNCGIYNNTAVGGGLRYSSNTSGVGSTGCTVENNVFTNSLLLSYFRGECVDSSSMLSRSDYNDFYGLPANNAMYYNGWLATLAAWTGATGFDSHSIQSNPNLDANGKPLPGSHVIQAGANLTGLGIPALNLDRAGNGRPSTGPWDIGAYQFSSSAGNQPAAPENLTATVQ